LSVIATLAAAAGAAAQVVPDTTAPERYFPLGLGDAWELYKPPDDWSFPVTWHQRREVVGDTLIGGERYALYSHTWYDPATLNPLGPTRTLALRVDPATGVIESATGPEQGFFYPLYLVTCPLSAPFNAVYLPGECVGMDIVTTSGGPATLTVGDDVVETTAKCYDTQGGGEYVACFYAGIGLARAITPGGGPRLTYARVGGNEYGTPILAAEPPVAPVALSVSLAPSPTSGPFSLMIDLPRAGAILVETLDAGGRRVHREVRTFGSGRHELSLDGSAWAAGPYLVRVSMGASAATLRLVIR
jgi:hypothetical protein